MYKVKINPAEIKLPEYLVPKTGFGEVTIIYNHGKVVNAKMNQSFKVEEEKKIRLSA